MKQVSILKNIISLWKYLAKNNRKSFILLFILMIISSFSEIISLGAIIPFLSVLSAPEKLMAFSWFQPIIQVLEIKSADELLLPITLGFIIVTIFATLVRILLLWTNTQLTTRMGIELKVDVYKRALYQPYEIHIMQNSSHLISIVTEKIAVAIGSGINHVLMILISCVTIFAIIITFLFVSPIIAIMIFIILGGSYLLIGYMTRKEIIHNGDIIAKNQPIAVKYTQEGLGGIRDIIIGNSQNMFITLYSNITSLVQTAIMKNVFLSMLPKSLLEMIGITFIAIFAYFLQSQDSNQLDALPILGVLALGAQRLLPALQQIYFSWSNINGSNQMIMDVLHYLEQPLPTENKKNKPIFFNQSIELKSMSFAYKDMNKSVLKDIDINILKGSRIGFMGTTGSGKSTLLDIIMGLLYPLEGRLIIDNIGITQDNMEQWQENIAHVPQNIFLLDASLVENIAFGINIDTIDMEKVKRVAKQASLDIFIESLPNGYHHLVGERGVQLSGGQKQRIGIARALYKEASVIIFDEATSALDENTEKNIMQSIYALDKELTILVVAHRVTTLAQCDLIYRLDNGRVVESGSYEKIVNNKTY